MTTFDPAKIRTMAEALAIADAVTRRCIPCELDVGCERHAGFRDGAAAAMGIVEDVLREASLRDAATS